MKILCICKASIKDGLGHLIRSITFCEKLLSTRETLDISLVLITTLELTHLFENSSIKCSVHQEFPNDIFEHEFDIVFLDMLNLETDHIHRLKDITKKIISLSPIFDQMQNCDTLITRTRYFGDSDADLPKQILSGLNFSIIRNDIKKIDPLVYRHNLAKKSLHIGISMGGTDPKNNTLEVIRHLKKIDDPVVFWVLLGEGYTYQYDQLVAEIKGDKTHEIILARTNKNMWEVLGNCSLVVLAGGLTSYEAAYAGLPSINYFSNKNRSYLVQELEENNLSLTSCFDFNELPGILHRHLEQKEFLLEVNTNAQKFNPFTSQEVEEILNLK